MTDKKIEDQNKEMLNAKELDQVSGGGWCESIGDMMDADQYKKYGITIVKAPWFDDNIYSYKGEEYNKTDLFKQLKKDGARTDYQVMKDAPCLGVTMETEEMWTK